MRESHVAHTVMPLCNVVDHPLITTCPWPQVLDHPQWEWLMDSLALLHPRSSIRAAACDCIRGVWTVASPNARLRMAHSVVALANVLPQLGGRASEVFALLLTISADMASNEQLSTELSKLCATLGKLMLEQAHVISQVVKTPCTCLESITASHRDEASN